MWKLNVAFIQIRTVYFTHIGHVSGSSEHSKTQIIYRFIALGRCLCPVVTHKLEEASRVKKNMSLLFAGDFIVTRLFFPPKESSHFQRRCVLKWAAAIDTLVFHQSRFRFCLRRRIFWKRKEKKTSMCPFYFVVWWSVPLFSLLCFSIVHKQKVFS